MTMQLGDFAAGSTVEFKWNSFSGLGGSIVRATDGVIRVYKGHSDVQRISSAGITDTETFDALTGLNHVQIDLSDNTDAGFYAAGSEYQVVLQGAVIDGQTVNAALAHFSIERAGGFASVLARLPASLVSGRIDASVGAMANNVMTAAAAASDLTPELQAGLATAAALSTVDGKVDALGVLATAINAKTTTLPTDPADASVIAGRFDTLDTAVGDVPTAVENADALLNRDLATGADSGSASVRTVRQALRFLRNKWSIAAGVLTVCKEDDTTASWTAAVTTDGAAEPVIASDPAS